MLIPNTQTSLVLLETFDAETVVRLPILAWRVNPELHNPVPVTLVAHEPENYVVLDTNTGATFGKYGELCLSVEDAEKYVLEVSREEVDRWFKADAAGKGEKP